MNRGTPASRARREAGAPARLESAFLLACELHRGQTRKDGETPFIFHLMAVASLVAEAGGDENQVIAALLHDAIEDAGGEKARSEIRRRFGEDVLEIVEGCTDTDRSPKPCWRRRKEAHLTRLRRAPDRVRLVCAADKLHNLRSLARELRAAGEDVWQRFRGGQAGTLWYYSEAARALGEGWRHPLLGEMEGVLEEVRSLAGPEREAGPPASPAE